MSPPSNDRTAAAFCGHDTTFASRALALQRDCAVAGLEARVVIEQRKSGQFIFFTCRPAAVKQAAGQTATAAASVATAAGAAGATAAAVTRRKPKRRPNEKRKEKFRLWRERVAARVAATEAATAATAAEAAAAADAAAAATAAAAAATAVAAATAAAATAAADNAGSAAVTATAVTAATATAKSAAAPLVRQVAGEQPAPWSTRQRKRGERLRHFHQLANLMGVMTTYMRVSVTPRVRTAVMETLQQQHLPTVQQRQQQQLHQWLSC